MVKAPVFGSRIRDDWDDWRRTSERAGLRYRVHRDVKDRRVKREREYMIDLDRAHNRGERDSLGNVINVSAAFGDWAGDVSGTLRGRKSLTDYADRGFMDRLRSVSTLVYGAAGDAAIMGECMRRDGAADLVAAAFLALELIDAHGDIDTLRSVAGELVSAWGRVLDGRVVDLADDVPPVESESDTFPLVDDGYWECVLSATDAEDVSAIEDWEIASWEIAESVAEPLTAGRSTSAQNAPTGSLPAPSISAPIAWPITWTATRKIARNVSGFAHSRPGNSQDSTDSAAPILPPILPPVTYYVLPNRRPPLRRPAGTMGDCGPINRGGSSIRGHIRNARAYAAVGVTGSVPAPRRPLWGRVRDLWRAHWAETCARQERIERRLRGET